MKEMNVTAFKAQCLKLIDDTHTLKTEVVITKRGKPLAKLVPLDDDPAPSILGAMAGTGRTVGDLTEPLDVEWDAYN